MGVMLDAVCGLEVGNRQSIHYFPRKEGTAGLAELETGAANWVRDQCHGEDEESEAFRDAAVCGVGVTEMLMDYDQDPDGNILTVRRDPLRTFPDSASNKKCFEDARYVFYADWMDNAEIEAKWPEKYSTTTPWDGLDEGKGAHNADLAFLYRDQDSDFQKHAGQSMVLQYQCWWREEFYRVVDPQTKELVSFEKDKFNKIKKAYKEAHGEDLKYVKQSKKVYYRGFYCGRTELEYDKSPCQRGFTFQFITAKRDRNQRMWYGIVRPMKDPQRWANKWLSQILHIINSNAKGGAFVEEGALKDPRKAEKQWAANSPLIMLNEGGIARIKDRNPTDYPQGLDRLMNFAFESLPFVSGINLEAIGLANRDQAGVLEEQRRKSAYGILSPLFDSLRLYRKQQGKLLLFFIREYISDGRLVKVVGQNGTAKYLPLFRNEESDEYDIVIDTSPNSPDYREKTWQSLQQILPVMMKEGIPIPPTIFDYAPLPANVAAEFKQLVQQGGNIPQMKQQMQEMQGQLQKAGQDIQKLTEENGNLKVGAQVEILKLQQRQGADTMKTSAKMREVEINAMVERANSILDNTVKQIVAQAKLDSEERRHVSQIMADFKLELRKAAEGEGAAGAIVKPIGEQLKKLTKAVSDIHDTSGKSHKVIETIAERQNKPKKRRMVVKRGPDNSFQVDQSEA